MEQHTSRVLWMVRHGERVDNIDPTWKLNPPRGAWDDPVLSQRGLVQAAEVGVHLGEALHSYSSTASAAFTEARIDHIVTSPYIRCIQTSRELLKAAGLLGKVQLKVEPGLCESLSAVRWPQPGFLEADELATAFPQLIDTSYTPIVVREDMLAYRGDSDFSCVRRIKHTLEKLLEGHQGNVVAVSHGSPIAAAHWLLTGELQYVGQCTVSKYQLLDSSGIRSVGEEGMYGQRRRDDESGMTSGECSEDSVDSVEGCLRSRSKNEVEMSFGWKAATAIEVFGRRPAVKCLKVNDCSHLSDKSNLRDQHPGLRELTEQCL